MKIETTEQIIKKEYPEIYKEFKSKNPDLSKFRFSFEIAETIRGYTFNEIISGKATKDKERDNGLDIEDRLQERLQNVTVWIKASSGRCHYTSNALDKIPFTVIETYRKMITEQRKERERIQAMSPEERTKNTNALLKKLRKSSDFFMIDKDGTLKSGKDIEI